jgi:hypothetical protein
MLLRGLAYYRLGKNLFGSGILSRYSFCALTVQTMAVMPRRAAPMTAVLAFQFVGCAYQPPAGDQTCFGYLDSQRFGLHAIGVSFLRDLSSSSHCEALFSGDGGVCIEEWRSEVVPPMG